MDAAKTLKTLEHTVERISAMVTYGEHITATEIEVLAKATADLAIVYHRIYGDAYDRMHSVRG